MMKLCWRRQMPAKVNRRSVSVNPNHGSGLQFPNISGLFKSRALRLGCPALFCVIFCLFAALMSFATDVVTYHYDIARTGHNLQETILTTKNVNSNRFGKLFTSSVDGIIDAQPLFLSKVSLPGQGKHDVMFA